LAATERTDARPVKRVVLLRLFYGGAMLNLMSRGKHQRLFFPLSTGTISP